MDDKTMTVGELRQQLSPYPDEAAVIFGIGNLTLSRVKSRAPIGGHIVQFEFNELYEITDSPNAH